MKLETFIAIFAFLPALTFAQVDSVHIINTTGCPRVDGHNNNVLKTLIHPV